MDNFVVWNSPSEQHLTGHTMAVRFAPVDEDGLILACSLESSNAGSLGGVMLPYKQVLELHNYLSQFLSISADNGVFRQDDLPVTTPETATGVHLSGSVELPEDMGFDDFVNLFIDFTERNKAAFIGVSTPIDFYQ